MRFKTVGHAIGLLVSLAMSVPAAAADPTASNIFLNGTAAPLSFLEYTSGTPVGAGRVNNDNLYYIDERIGIDPISHETVKSWYIFFDPLCQGLIQADITFDNAIKGVRTTRAALNETNSIFGIDLNNDTFLNDYRSRPLTGTERTDATSWSYNGNVLHIDWKASNPGDHIRVTTSIPEPQTYALLLAGLGLVGAAARRRKPSRV